MNFQLYFSMGSCTGRAYAIVYSVLPLKQIDRLPLPKMDFHHPGAIKVFKLMIPAIIAGGILQINLLVDTIFALILNNWKSNMAICI